MQKKSTIIIVIISILLCSALIATAVLSGTITKYVTSSGMRALARVAKWGIQVDAGSDLSHEIRSRGGVLMIQASNNNNVIAPGTTGSLSYVRTTGSPEVSYSINIDGDKADGTNAFTVGDGYYANSRLVRGEDGKPVEYFPIIIRFSIFDINSDGTKTIIKSKTYAIKRTDISVDVQCNDLADLVTKVNTAISSELDVANNAPAPNGLDRVYSVDWDWIYSPTTQTSYQTNYLDTALCEAVAADKSKFDIRINLNFEMAQTD